MVRTMLGCLIRRGGAERQGREWGEGRRKAVSAHAGVPAPRRAMPHARSGTCTCTPRAHAAPAWEAVAAQEEAQSASGLRQASRGGRPPVAAGLPWHAWHSCVIPRGVSVRHLEVVGGSGLRRWTPLSRDADGAMHAPPSVCPCLRTWGGACGPPRSARADAGLSSADLERPACCMLRAACSMLHAA
jgi:hypothetical protein